MSNVINLIEKMAIEGNAEEVMAKLKEVEVSQEELQAIAQKDLAALEKLLEANPKVLSLMAPAEDEDQDDDDDDQGSNDESEASIPQYG